MVLPAPLRSEAEVLAAMDTELSQDDPGPRLSLYPDAVRDAIRKKQLLTDMAEEAVEAAWGVPDRKSISFQGTERTEVWLYEGGRKAFIREGRLERTTGTTDGP
jgi:hypothetical protein